MHRELLVKIPNIQMEAQYVFRMSSVLVLVPNFTMTMVHLVIHPVIQTQLRHVILEKGLMMVELPLMDRVLLVKIPNIRMVPQYACPIL